MINEKLIKDYISENYSDFKYLDHIEKIDGQGFAYVDVKCSISDEILHVYIQQLDLITFVYSKINNK